MELFGSTYTGFALKDSDINMNLRFRDHTINSSVSDFITIYPLWPHVGLRFASVNIKLPSGNRSQLMIH